MCIRDRIMTDIWSVTSFSGTANTRRWPRHINCHHHHHHRNNYIVIIIINNLIIIITYMLSASATLSWWWSPSLLLHTLSWADQINHHHRLRHHQQCWKHHHCHYHHWTSQAVITHTNHQIKWEAWMPIYIIHNEEEIPYNDRPWLPWSASITIYTLILRKIFAEIILVHFQLWCLNKEITICCLCQKKMNLYNHYSKQCHSQIALFSEIKLTQKIVTNCHV